MRVIGVGQGFPGFGIEWRFFEFELTRPTPKRGFEFGSDAVSMCCSEPSLDISVRALWVLLIGIDE